MKKPCLRSKADQIITRSVAPGQHHCVGKDFAERAQLISYAGGPAFTDAESDELITARTTPFRAAQLEYRGTGRIRNFESINQVVAAIIAERAERHIMKRAMRNYYEPFITQHCFEGRKDCVVKITQTLIGHLFELPKVCIGIFRTIAEFL